MNPADGTRNKSSNPCSWKLGKLGKSRLEGGVSPEMKCYERAGGGRAVFNCQASVGNDSKRRWPCNFASECESGLGRYVCDVRSCASDWGYSQQAITFILNEQGLRNFIRILGLQRSNVQQIICLHTWSFVSLDLFLPITRHRHTEYSGVRHIQQALANSL
jgi:hypothetical protein